MNRHDGEDVLLDVEKSGAAKRM